MFRLDNQEAVGEEAEIRLGSREAVGEESWLGSYEGAEGCGVKFLGVAVAQEAVEVAQTSREMVWVAVVSWMAREEEKLRLDRGSDLNQCYNRSLHTF